MKDLAAIFESAGCTTVGTYIQSGNVVFRAALTLAARIPSLVASALADRFGLRVAVIVRTACELEHVAEHNPFLGTDADVDRLHVAFLANAPSAARVAALDAHRSPPDRFVVRGREIYLHLPNGVARSKLTNQYFDSLLATTSTVRSYKTVLALVERLRSGPRQAPTG